MTVRIEDEGQVRVVTIDRPEVRNAVDRPTAAALDDAMVTADADPEVHAIVLTGAGGTFCAGADLHAVGGADPDRANRVERSHRGPMGPTRRRLGTPTIAAVEVTPSPAGSSSPRGVTSAWPRRPPSSGCSAAAGASP